MNKPNHFSNNTPTKKNHYSIRKFTVGTASIIVGSFLFFGQAHAEENPQGTTGTGFQRETVGTVETTGQPAAGNPGTATPAQGAQNDQNNQAGGAQTGTPNNAQDTGAPAQAKPEAGTTQQVIKLNKMLVHLKIIKQTLQ